MCPWWQRWIAPCATMNRRGTCHFFDRAHNDFWDVLLTTGALGLLAYWTFIGLLMFYIGRSLGVLGTRHAQIGFWLCLTSGSLVSGVIWILWQGVGFLGLGIRFGTITGLIVFLLICCWRNASPARSCYSSRPNVPVDGAALGDRRPSR